jgi:hypothetical protein
VKTVKSSNYQKAFAVMYGKWLSVNTQENLRPADGSVVLSSRQPNPEEAVIKKDLFDKMSAEAKEIVETILEGPAEIIEHFASPKEKRINVRRILSYYQIRWSSPLISKRVIEEIREWVQNLK